ncbi:uncharacterized protein B0I36DRAFT_151615 [Microdochium trichocladiopsis]|uniref:Uncharacterized protein n=1 Tax=Microdochium trichocladiopsis TaxID=1682393 RepID=A0A9P8XZX6_9PEZI|nr:uncharacterized protein B0I36DRAFT_151615 [Microdochium trichocladiopsis]KAH7025956.1 hypothetical protein B0I36DRAFT_151615 [Microdochium trichocladiopsis]
MSCLPSRISPRHSILYLPRPQHPPAHTHSHVITNTTLSTTSTPSKLTATRSRGPEETMSSAAAAVWPLPLHLGHYGVPASLQAQQWPPNSRQASLPTSPPFNVCKQPRLPLLSRGRANQPLVRHLQASGSIPLA